MKNKFRKYLWALAIFGICLLIFLFSMFQETNIFSTLFRYVVDSNYRENYSLAESDVKTVFNIFQVIPYVMTHHPWRFDVSFIFGTNLFQLILPLIVSMCGLVYYEKYYSIEQFCYYRKQQYKKRFLQSIAWHAFVCACSIFLAFLVFYCINFFITKGRLSSYVGRELYLDILGYAFYDMHPYLYYVMDGITRFFIIPFIYAFLSCTLVTVVKGQKEVLFASNIYYYGLSVIGFGLYAAFGDIAVYFNPSAIMASGTYTNIHTLLLFVVHIIPFIACFVWIDYKGKHVEI